MYEVRVFSTDAKDAWRTRVGKYGPVYILGGYETEEAARDAADSITASGKSRYGRVFRQEGSPQ